MLHAIKIEKMKKIVVSTEVYKHLCAAFSVSRKTVSLALNYKSDTDLSKRIRKHALQKGGDIAGSDVMETCHDTEGVMTHRFGKRVEIAVWKASGNTHLYIDGILKEEYEDISVEQLLDLQQRAKQIAMTL